jgi:alpha-L-fucosidase
MGEGPQMASSEPIRAQGFNEGRGKPFTAEDVRFTTKNGAIYAFIMGAPAGPVKIQSLGKDAKLLDGTISGISLLGSDQKLRWVRNADSLVIEKPEGGLSDVALVFKIQTRP